MENSKKSPNWFDGNIYENGGVVIVESSGEEFELNNLELSIYDFLCGVHVVALENHFIDIEIDFEVRFERVWIQSGFRIAFGNGFEISIPKNPA